MVKFVFKFLIDERKNRNLDLAFDQNQIPSKLNYTKEEESSPFGILGLLSGILVRSFREIQSLDQIDDLSVERYKAVSYTHLTLPTTSRV